MSARLRLVAAALAVVSGLSAALAVGAPAADAGASHHQATGGPSAWRIDGTVYDSVVAGHRVYVAGTFRRVVETHTGRRVARSNLVAFTLSGRLVRTWHPAANGAVRTIAWDPEQRHLLLGGAFTRVGGRARSHLASVTAGTGAATGWAPTANDGVRALIVRGSWVYVGGMFGTINGEQHLGLARVSRTTGAVDSGWVPAASQGRVDTLSLDSRRSRLVVGGNFKSLSGQPRWFLGAVDLSTGAASSWAPRALCGRCKVLAATVDGSSVYVGVAGRGGRAAAYSASGPLRWQARANGDVQAVAVRGHRVYIGGHFRAVSQVRRSQFAVLTTGRGAVTREHLELSRPRPGIWTVSVTATRLRIGGGFAGVDPTSCSRFCTFRLSALS